MPKIVHELIVGRCDLAVLDLRSDRVVLRHNFLDGYVGIRIGSELKVVEGPLGRPLLGRCGWRGHLLLVERIGVLRRGLVEGVEGREGVARDGGEGLDMIIRWP